MNDFEMAPSEAWGKHCSGLLPVFPQRVRRNSVNCIPCVLNHVIAEQRIRWNEPPLCIVSEREQREARR